MKWQLLALSLTLAISPAGSSPAQQPMGDVGELDRPISLSELQPTPEMWFYQQSMRQYQDPALAVRQKAEFRAAQRAHRLAAQKWFGVSNARPMAAFTPWTTWYSPTWVSNTWQPYRWAGVGGTTVVIEVEDDTLRR